ncbi:PAS domain-containing protein [Telmatobacter sp. DSM 110680]|uniref:histidine kinase n=1 Tax=Telmatobacter sp. DSM 110680 TaxID=3036704 RepID=A0AAU7DN05_9BACT
MRWWPRTVRWQLILWLMLLEVLSVALFAIVLVKIEGQEIRKRALERLTHQATSVALQAEEAYRQQHPELVLASLRMMGEAPSVAGAKITDAAGNILFVSGIERPESALEPAEKAQIAQVIKHEPLVFSFGKNRFEGVKAIYVGDALRGYAWVETDRSWDNEILDTVLRSSFSFGLIWIGASALLVLLLSRSISRPLGVLQGGTRALMEGPATRAQFPLPVKVDNEFGDLIQAFNRMVASLEEQRSGLNDTLSLLDSMLANAPIGLVFFDRQSRIVRVNEVFAKMTGVALSRHLGRMLPELLPEPTAKRLEDAVRHVLETEATVHDLEVTGQRNDGGGTWTWLMTAYPVRPSAEKVRWVGAIVTDVSERKRSEDALRRTEKLAATGRLAASIAHEINNPLEAITNLLYLLRRFCKLDESALNYVTIAEREVHRMSEITQQTLRFYRQSTLPARASMEELLDSVLDMYIARLATLGVSLDRRYDPNLDLFCFAGELRQVFSNFVSNAMDAMAGGGRLIVSARRSRDWVHPEREGVRFTIADTGSGMAPEVRAHLFEAFFTTKGATGTGLGLWVSHEIILKHHGIIAVRSRAGNSSGTVFHIFFPDNEVLTSGAQLVEGATSEA